PRFPDSGGQWFAVPARVVAWQPRVTAFLAGTDVTCCRGGQPATAQKERGVLRAERPSFVENHLKECSCSPAAAYRPVPRQPPHVHEARRAEPFLHLVRRVNAMKARRIPIERVENVILHAEALITERKHPANPLDDRVFRRALGP